AGVECCGCREESSEPEKICQQNQVTFEPKWGAVAAQGNQQGACRGRHEPHHRACSEHPRRGRAEDRIFSEELDEIIVRLQERRPDTTGKERLRLVDDAHKESGGKLRAARTWTASRMIAFIVVLLTPQQQGDESDEYVQQVSLDAPALRETEKTATPRSETPASRRRRAPCPEPRCETQSAVGTAACYRAF